MLHPKHNGPSPSVNGIRSSFVDQIRGEVETSGDRKPGVNLRRVDGFRPLI